MCVCLHVTGVICTCACVYRESAISNMTSNMTGVSSPMYSTHCTYAVLHGQTLYLHRVLSIRDDKRPREKGLVWFTALTRSRTQHGGAGCRSIVTQFALNCGVVNLR